MSSARTSEASDFERLFQKALDLRNEKQFALAEQILVRLCKLSPQTAAVFGVLGHVQWEQGDSGHAVESFRKAVSLAPRSEVASLGLFHTLWEADDKEHAIEEKGRFLSGASSPEYARLARGLFYEELSEQFSAGDKEKWARALREFALEQFSRNPGLLQTRRDDFILLLWIKEHPGDRKTAELMPAARRIMADTRKAQKKRAKAKSRSAG